MTSNGSSQIPGADPGDRVLRIDCADCVLQSTSACADCVVTWIVDREPGREVVIDVAEVRALKALQAGGLVPGLRHRSRRISA